MSYTVIFSRGITCFLDGKEASKQVEIEVFIPWSRERNYYNHYFLLCSECYQMIIDMPTKIFDNIYYPNMAE